MNFYSSFIFKLKINPLDRKLSQIEVGDINKTIQYGADFAASILKAGAMSIIIGGEYTVSLAGPMGIDRVLQGKYGLIRLNCHLDADPDTNQLVYHGCPGICLCAGRRGIHAIRIDGT